MDNDDDEDRFYLKNRGEHRLTKAQRLAASRKSGETIRAKGVKITLPQVPWEDPQV